MVLDAISAIVLFVLLELWLVEVASCVRISGRRKRDVMVALSKGTPEGLYVIALSTNDCLLIVGFVILELKLAIIHEVCMCGVPIKPSDAIND